MDRFEIVDQNFKKFIESGNLPPAKSQTSESESCSKADFLDLFETQLMSRHLDYMARRLKTQNQSFYTIGSAGHEGNAAVGKVFSYKDMAFLHYRSGAQYIQRAKQLPTQSPLHDLLLSFVASSEDPIAAGRHKVFGSVELNIPPQTSTIASHLPKAVGCALSLNRAKTLNNPYSKLDPNSVVLCTFGDASVNHAVSQTAFNTASWMSYQNIPLPIVFNCEDNDIGISVPTPPQWIENSMMSRPRIQYFYCDGLNLFDVYKVAKECRDYVSRTKRPAFLHLKTVRLMGHAGSDVENLYFSISEIEAREFDDPLLHSARICLENKYLSKDELLKFYESIRSQIEQVAKYAILRPKLRDPKEIKTSIVPTKKIRELPAQLNEEKRKAVFDREWNKLTSKYHMAKLLNFALMDILARFENTVIFGEDVARKGGVYHVTAGLFQKFGIKRVFNSLLDETSILGTAIGLAHNGFVPIPEIQFLAYLHNAEDQLRGEASTLSFFSNGQYTNGMVIRVAGLAYQKGFGGHFHNDNSFAVLRDIPGLILAIPSNGKDAVKMLRTCVRQAHEYGRVCVFLEPIALYMTKDLHEKDDNLWSSHYPEVNEEIDLGEFHVEGDGEITIVTYGNGYYYSLQAVKEFGKKVKVIDLRWVAPLNEEKLCEELKSAKKILVVEESRKTGSFSEQLVTLFVEKLSVTPKIKVVAAEDCFIPLGVAAASGLPSKDSILKALKEL